MNSNHVFPPFPWNTQCISPWLHPGLFLLWTEKIREINLLLQIKIEKKTHEN